VSEGWPGDDHVHRWAELHMTGRPGGLVGAWLRATGTVARPLAKAGVPPNLLTIAALAAALAAVPLAGIDGWVGPAAAAAAVVVSGLLDALDGAVAVQAGRTTRVGFVLDSVLDRLADAGATVVEVRDDVLFELGDLLVPILLPEAWAVHGERVASQPGWYGADTLRLFRSAGQASPAARQQALARRAVLLPAAEALLDDVDVLLGPTAPFAAPELTPPIDTPEGEVESLFTGPFNVTGQPAVTLPAGLTADGLPFGVQLAGRTGADGPLLAAAARIEAVLGYVNPAPRVP
jgi:Asp-tRNA(Asn)/Glu-tRNA(Gln) amidotransferase A subunit family amidase